MSAVATAAGPASVAPALLWAWLEQSRDLLVITDRSGRITWANERFCQVSGLTEGGQLLTLAPLGTSGQATRDMFMMALGGAELADTEIELRSTGNVAIHVQARVVDAAGQLLWTLCDVTTERQQEARAERLAGLLEMAQEFGRLGVWEREIASGAGHWDRHVFGFWGICPTTGTPDFERAIGSIHPDDRRLLNYIESTHQAGRYSQHYRVLHPDGSTRWIHSQWEVQNSTDGEPVRAVGIMMDDTEAYHSAHALGEANAQLKLALDLGKIAIWRHDLQTERIHYNDGAFALIDVPVRPEGVAVSDVRNIIHPDDLPLVIASSQAALRSDRPTDTEARYRHSNGSWRYLLTRQVVQRNPSGVPLALLGVALDVTERVEQRRRAEELGRRLDAAAKAARIGIWSISVADGEADWNEQMYELFDLSGAAEPPPWHDWLEHCVHPNDRERVRAGMRGFLAAGESPPEVEFRSLRRDGSSRWIVVRCDVDRTAPGSRLLGVALDVTEHHVALEALREASERSVLITHHAGIGTWEAELHSDEQHWDEQMFRLRGLEPTDRAPSHEQRLALVHPDDLQSTTGFWPGALDPRGSGAYEFRVRQPDGSYRWLASRSAPVFGSDGEPVRRVGVNWDVTESKNAEQARQQAALAAQAIQAKTRFLSRMSHELRTPLNAVLGFTQLLQIEAGKAAAATQLAKLAHIRAAGEHLLALINDVLDLSNLESGELQLQLAAVELDGLVAEAQALIEPLAQRHGVTLQAGVTAGTVRADAGRLRQVLINLLTNAVKYNRRGGRVLIESCAMDGAVVLAVQDTGRGLTSEQLLHLFEPFNRHGADTDGNEGAGIGLTIVKALVEGMGGAITVSSHPGEGTRFEITLMAATGAPAGAGDAAGPTTWSGELQRCNRPGQLLYIEDNSVNVMLVEELVRSLSGLQIASESTGAAGVERACALRPDAILIDLQLPDFDGYEVLRRLRAQPETATTPCIALSANALPEDIERGLEAGFSDYWTKPINFKTFLSSLEKLFPSVSLRQDI